MQGDQFQGVTAAKIVEPRLTIGEQLLEAGSASCAGVTRGQFLSLSFCLLSLRHNSHCVSLLAAKVNTETNPPKEIMLSAPMVCDIHQFLDAIADSLVAQVPSLEDRRRWILQDEQG